MSRKFLSLLVIFAMVFAFGACATDTEEDPVETEATTATTTTTAAATTTTAATTTEEETDEVENPFVEHMEISWLVGIYTSHLYEDGRWDQVELEEKFNVKLNMWNVMVDSNNMEQVQMMLAAGDVPDYGFYYTTGRYLYEQGMGRTIPMEMIEQFYPSYYRQFEVEPIGRLFNRVEDPESPHYGELYGLMTFTPLAYHSGHINLWRLDWLEDLGYVMDNLEPLRSEAYPEWSESVYFSSTHFSVEDVKEIFRAFTEDDPNYSGMDDTFASGFANSWYDMYISYAMFGFDTHGNHMYEDPVTGDFVPFFAYTPYRDMFVFLTEMLDRGYMRWVPGEEAFHRELMAIWATGNTGYMHTLGAGRVIGFGADALEWPPGSILTHEEDARFVVTRPPGEGKFRAYWPFNWGTGYDYPIGDISDEKLERLFHLLEYAYFGENWLRYKWGIEGVHYRWSGEPFDSTIIFADEEDIPPRYAGVGATQGFGQFGNINFVSDSKVYFSFDAFNNQNIDFWEVHNPGGFYDNSLWIRPDKFVSHNTMPHDLYDEFVELRDETMGDINEVRSDFTDRIWDGQVANINVEWEQYIEQLYAAGLQDWVNIMNRDEIGSFLYYTGYE